MPNRLKRSLIVVAAVVAVSVLWFAAHSVRRAETKRYAMTGTVIAVNPQDGTASVHNDDIPGFMRPMRMEYKVVDREALARLKPGDNISATLVGNIQDGWALENISVLPPKSSR